MRGHSARRIVLRVFAFLVMFGGIVRIFADRHLFQAFLIEGLWIDHPYFIYIYRVLGAFVSFVGATMFFIAGDPQRYVRLLRVWGFFFLFIAGVMFLFGFLLNMALMHYAFDFTFCLAVAVACFSFGRKKRSYII